MVNKQMRGKISNFNNVILLYTRSTLKANIMNTNFITGIITIRNPVVMIGSAGGG